MLKSKIFYSSEGLYIRQEESYSAGNGRNKWDKQTVILSDKEVAKLKKVIAQHELEQHNHE